MKELPRVLIFIDWYLPGFKAGGPIRSCANMVSHLKSDFSFYIITRDTDYTTTTPYATVTSNCWIEVEGAQVYYISKTTLKSSLLRGLIKDVKPDIIYVNGIYSFYFSILPLIISKQLGYSKILVAGRGMLAQSAIQVKGLKKKLFFKLAAFYNLYRNVTFHATNHVEASDIREVIGNHALIKVAPNLPEALTELDDHPEPRLKTPFELKLISVARIAPEKNTMFALEVLRTYKGEGNIKFDMYGPVYDESYMKACNTVIAQMPANVSVHFKGSLNKEDVPETLQQYHALFMPTKGENFGHIILESLLAGSPVLISDQTPWKNLAEKGVGYDIPLTDTEDYHVALIGLLQLNQEQFNLLSDKAFQYAKAYCQDKAHLDANKALFEFD